MKCCEDNCSVAFGALNHKYQCEICGSYFCDNHCCNTSYIKHFRGHRFYKIDKAVNSGGYVCKQCFAKYSFHDNSLIDNIFDRKCHIEGCANGLNNLFESKYSCISCGKISCKEHSVEISKTTKEWRQQHLKYPMAERVCLKCFNEKFAHPILNYHPKALNLQFCSGTPSGRRKAIIVHGTLSKPMSLEWFAHSLTQSNLFDSVWLFDDLGYHGRVNEAKKIKIEDLVPLNPKTIVTTLVKIMGTKAFQVIYLPPYIVEGAGRNLAMTIKFLGWKNVTLIGHSLGGFVTRCAVETHDINCYVENVITLGSPFQAWRKFNKPKQWNFVPSDKVRYLAILGKDDWVAMHRNLGDLTNNDNALKNVIKIIVPHLDHATIHKEANAIYLYEFIDQFLSGALLKRNNNFYLRNKKGTFKGCFSGFHGDPIKDDECFRYSGEWIEFNKI